MIKTLRVSRFLIISSILMLVACGDSQVVQVKRVVDGDTIVLADDRTVRVMGIDTPEIRGQCQSERDRAQTAKIRMMELVARGVRLEVSRDRDRYGRTLARVFDNRGRDIGQILISEGLARPYNGRGQRGGWCD